MLTGSSSVAIGLHDIDRVTANIKKASEGFIPHFVPCTYSLQVNPSEGYPFESANEGVQCRSKVIDAIDGKLSSFTDVRLVTESACTITGSYSVTGIELYVGDRRRNYSVGTTCTCNNGGEGKSHGKTMS